MANDKFFTLNTLKMQVEKMVNVNLEVKKINNTTIEFKGFNILVIVNKNDNKVKAKRKGKHFQLVGSIELSKEGVTI